MLPFHKRSRVNSSIEIGTDELEAIELPQVRPPSSRPSYIARPSISFAHHNDDDEMTVIRMDKRLSSSPPPSSRSLSMQVPRFPRSAPVPSFERPRYDHEDVTLLHPHSSSRSLPFNGTLRSASEIPPPPSSRLLEEAPRSAVAVDAASSSLQRAVDLSMSVSSVNDLSKLRRPTMGWATGLVVAGVFAGIIGAFLARGEGLAAAASLVDPSAQSHVAADVSHVAQTQNVQAQPVQVQAPIAIAAGAAAPPQQASQKPAAPSCNADATPAKVEVKEAAPKIVVERVVEHVAPVVHYAAPPPVVHRSEPTTVAVAAPPAVTRPAAVRASARKGDDMESASAADALAKAQLDAALSR